jgi:hypothetical protein
MENAQHLDRLIRPICNNRPVAKIQRADARRDVVAWGAAMGSVARSAAWASIALV